MSLTQNTYTQDFDGLILRKDNSFFTDRAVVPQGNVLSRGSLLGRITVDGKVILSLAAAADGSETPYAVLANDVDTSASGTNADTEVVIYLTGSFVEEEVTFGTGHTQASTKDGLRNLQIFIRKYSGAQ